MNILITGGASGLGEAITCRFGRAGTHRIYFTFNRSAEKAKALVKEFPGAEAIMCDFLDAASLDRLLLRIDTMDLDVMVNNALPAMKIKHFHQSDPDGFLSSFSQNVMPTLRITQKAIKAFRKKKSGKIITILTSSVVNRPPVGFSEYVANKAYLLSMSRSWAAENAKLNITSNCISPSMMRTALISEMDERQIENVANSNPSGRLVTPDEVADTVLFLAGASQQINGVNLLMNGGVDVI